MNLHVAFLGFIILICVSDVVVLFKWLINFRNTCQDNKTLKYHIKIHLKTYSYIYIYIYTCLCVCERERRCCFFFVFLFWMVEETWQTMCQVLEINMQNSIIQVISLENFLKLPLCVCVYIYIYIYKYYCSWLCNISIYSKNKKL